MGHWLAIALISVAACVRPSSPAPAPAQDVRVTASAPPPGPRIVPEPVTTEPSPAMKVPTIYERPAQWPPAVVFPAGFDPEHASVTIGEHGDLLVSHNVADAAIRDVVVAWTEALTAAGFTPRAPCTETSTRACVWTGHDRLLAIAVGPNWNATAIDVSVHWLPVGHVETKMLPGPCVTPPVVHRRVRVDSAGIDQDGEFRQGSTQWNVSTHPSADLDGDGSAEVLVPHTTSGECPWDIPHDVFVMRGGCGHRVGTIVGHLDARTHTSRFRKGLREIFTEAAWADRGSASPIPDHHTRERKYVFDGKRLKLSKDATRTGRCHHCGVVRCNEG